MNNNKSKMDNAAARFWDRYIEFIQKQGVKRGACRWYVKRVEQYTQVHPDQKLITHAPETVTRFLETWGQVLFFAISTVKQITRLDPRCC